MVLLPDWELVQRECVMSDGVGGTTWERTMWKDYSGTHDESEHVGIESPGQVGCHVKMILFFYHICWWVLNSSLKAIFSFRTLKTLFPCFLVSRNEKSCKTWISDALYAYYPPYCWKLLESSLFLRNLKLHSNIHSLFSPIVWAFCMPFQFWEIGLTFSLLFSLFFLFYFFGIIIMWMLDLLHPSSDHLIFLFPLPPGFLSFHLLALLSGRFSQLKFPTLLLYFLFL